MKTFAVIGGSGATKPDFLEGSVIEKVETPWGDPSSEIIRGRYEGMEIVYLPRHGRTIKKPPHMINYRANIWALAQYNPEAIVALCSVGGIVEDDVPGTIAIPDQILDFTWGRETSYNTGETEEINFIDFTNPFDDDLRDSLLDAAEELDIEVIDGGTYACMQGPRLETSAEIEKLSRDGAHYVGMTMMPEAALARELKLPYAALLQVVNPAAGVGDSENAVDLEAAGTILETAYKDSIDIALKAFTDIASEEE
ncbi:MAG: S-methyl-5'-thioinosine phosphorylase [Burkholderiales bacterium]|nr:S-methyl-5'-thioinosine phosphorylase [Burkholderiales bacterium]